MKKILVFIFTILILVLVWPIFAEWIPALAKSWRWFPLGFVISVIYAKEYLTTKQFGWLLVYSTVVCINALSGCNYVSNPVIAFTQFLGFYIISSAPILLLDDENNRCRKLYFYVFIALLVFTTVMSLIFNAQFPDVVRDDLRSTGLEDTYIFSYLYKYGLTHYQFAHAMPILIPSFILTFNNMKNSKLKRYIFLGLAIFCILHAFVSGATTPFLLAIMIFIMSLIVVPGTFTENKQTVLKLGVIMLPFLFDEVQVLVLQFLDSLIGGEGSIHEHLIDLMQSTEYGSSSGGLQSRQNLYSYAWKSFISSPIWGVNNAVTDLGGHSVFLDNLAAFGLLGFIPLLLYLINTFKTVKKYVESSHTIYYYLSAFAMFFLLAVKSVNIWTLSCFCFLTVPIIMKVSSENNE